MEDQDYCGENWLSAFIRRMWWLYLVCGGVAVGLWLGVYAMQLDAVKHDAAIYNTKSGQWEWLTQVPEISESELKVINTECKKLGQKAGNDPKCILMGR